MAIREAEAWLPALVVRLVERAAVAVLAGQLLLGVDQREVGLAIVLFDERRRVAPAQTEVEGQVVGRLEVVGGVERGAVLQVRPRLGQRAAALARDLIEEEVGNRRAAGRGVGGPGVGTAVGDVAEDAVVAGVVTVHHVVVPRPAELQRVAALQPGQALVDLEQAVVGIAGAAGRADVRHVVADAHLGEAVDRLRPADAQLVVQRTEAAQVERYVVERVVVVADQQVVDDAGADDAVPVGAHAPERVLAEGAVEQRHGGLFGARFVRLLGVAHVDLVGGRGVPVDLDVELVGLFPGSALAQIVVAEVAQWTADVGPRIEGLVGQQVTRELAEAAHRNLVVRERLASLRIVDDDRRARREQTAQIAVAPGVGDDRRERIGRRRLLASTLVVGEEEQLVLHDRPANGAAEDLAVEVRFAAAGPVGRPRRRRQLVVAPVVEAVAADVVGSRLDDHVDDRPGDVAELGRVVVGLDADLLHRVRARLVGDQVVDGVVHVDAVEHEVVGLFALAVDVGPAAAGVLQAVERARIGRGDPGGVERGGRQVAALHRQLLDLIASAASARRRRSRSAAPRWWRRPRPVPRWRRPRA